MWISQSVTKPTSRRRTEYRATCNDIIHLMCGRFGYINSDFKTYGVTGAPAGFHAVYNGAPSQPLPVIVEVDHRCVDLYRFGLIPFWSKTMQLSYSTINARSENILMAPTYRKPIRSQRCLVPCDFYFEWKRIHDKLKQPYLFRLKTKQSFALGGVWDVIADAEHMNHYSFAIVTTAPNSIAEKYHNRMPLILSPETWDLWLSDKTPIEKIIHLMKPYPYPETMEVFGVSPYVNSPDHNDPRVIEPLVV